MNRNVEYMEGTRAAGRKPFMPRKPGQQTRIAVLSAFLSDKLRAMGTDDPICADCECWPARRAPLPPKGWSKLNRRRSAAMHTAADQCEYLITSYSRFRKPPANPRGAKRDVVPIR